MNPHMHHRRSHIRRLSIHHSGTLSREALTLTLGRRSLSPRRLPHSHQTLQTLSEST